MAVPPCYADLGKSAKDIFNKGYGIDFLSFYPVILFDDIDKFWKDLNKTNVSSGFGLVKLDVKTKSASGVVRSFSVNG